MLHSRVKELLSFLKDNPDIRWQIKAPPDRTILYAGGFFRPMWQEIERKRRSDAQLRSKVLLQDVLRDIPTPSHSNLLSWVQELDRLEPWDQHGFVAWRALSGIFASNAVGKVSFWIGDPIDQTKVFAATELAVLARNPKIDPVTKDLVAYYQRCLTSRQSQINFGFTA